MSFQSQTNWTHISTNNITNLTAPPTGRCVPPPLSRAAAIGLTLTYVIVFLVALIGNSIVIHVVRMRLTNRVPFNLLIVNMAACDIIYAFAAAPFGIHYIWVSVLWFSGEFGAFLCKFKEFALVVSIATSVLTLSVMSVDRYLAIVHVLKRPLSRQKVFYAVIILWLVSFLLSSGELVKMKSLEFRGHLVCAPMWSVDLQTSILITKVEFNIKFVTLYAAPLVTMAIFYSSIMRFLWLRKVPGVKSDENDRKVKKQCQKVVLMLVTMVTVFAVGWLPVHVIHYLSIYTTLCPLPESAVIFMILLAHANCAINPCLYIVFNSSFREEFRRLMARCCLKEVPRTMSNLTLNGSTRTLPTTMTQPHADSSASSATSIIPNKGGEMFTSTGVPYRLYSKGEEDRVCSDTRL